MFFKKNIPAFVDKTSLPSDVHFYENASALLKPYSTIITNIQHLVGVPEKHFDALYRVLFNQYATFVQQLPASEAHHHAHAGGMLQHGLEVTLNALKSRSGMMLPPDSSAEVVVAKQDVWTYGITTASLLHDIGKPVVDQDVMLFDNEQKEKGLWSPFAGSMPETTAYYQLRYKNNRKHGLHERITPFVAQHIIPPMGFAWITSDIDLLNQWSAALIGDYDNAGIIGELVHQSDKQSVATNLSGGIVKQVSRKKPLVERLVTALRYLIDEGKLPLNINGAAGWRTNDDLWLVSKRALDSVRDQLLSEGQLGIPSRNDRLMDELQQNGYLITNNEKAIWKMQVNAIGWSKAHTLTLLRLNVKKLWPAGNNIPELFDGTVLPHSDSSENNIEKETIMLPATSSQASIHYVKPGTIPSATQDNSDATDNTVAPIITAKQQKSQLNTCGERFKRWLGQQIETKQLELNSVTSMVHVVEEGLLLVSPLIFKSYKDMDADVNWQKVQKQFTKLKLHERNEDRDTNIRSYHVYGEKSQKRKAMVKGYLIRNERIREITATEELPLPNKHLRLKC
jgi:integrating conjugative element relaxase (TIGR03760 family)